MATSLSTVPVSESIGTVTTSGEFCEAQEYLTEGGWFPAASRLLRTLRALGCCDYIAPNTEELLSRSSFPTTEVERAALAAVCRVVARVINEPPTALTAPQRTELAQVRRQAARFAQYRLRQLELEERTADRAAKRLTDLLEAIPDNSEPQQLVDTTGKKGKDINGRMLKTIAETPESLGWSARQWADYLVCSDGTVKATDIWISRLRNVRALLAADEAQKMDRSKLTPKGRRKPPHRSRA